jgi:hypothetical protein
MRTHLLRRMGPLEPIQRHWIHEQAVEAAHRSRRASCATSNSLEGGVPILGFRFLGMYLRCVGGVRSARRIASSRRRTVSSGDWSGCFGLFLGVSCQRLRSR